MEDPRTILHIGRMYNDRSRDEVCNAIRSIERVIEVDADLCRGTVAIRHDRACDPSALLSAVERAGYAPTILVEPPTPGRTGSRGGARQPANDARTTPGRSDHAII